MKYDFIKQGNLLYWRDPDNGLSDGAYQVISAPEKVEDDSVILIASGSSEAEVSASELSPIRTGRNRKEDFQRWKGILILKLLCANITAGRFNWRKYCTPQPYCGREICVTQLHCSFGQIGYTVHFPYTDMPQVEYDWEMDKLTIGKENWESYLQN